MSSDALTGRFSIGDLIKAGAISAHKDGNFGSLYPRIEDFADDGLPLLTAKVVNGGRIDFDAAQKLRTEKAARLPYGFIQAGDVLLSHNATVGRVAVVPEFHGQALIGTSLTYFRLDNKRLLPRYLACFFESRDFQNQLASVMGLSTRNQVPITAQRLLEVEVPPLNIQCRISEFVGALDDRITLLRETNTTLEAIAQALFKSWFVDFDPVRAKQEGRAPEGMDEATAALFPDGFEKSELGLVPRGWRRLALEEAYEINPTRKLKKGEAAPYLDMASVATSGHAASGVIEREMGSGSKFINGDTLLARITPCLENGKTAFVDFLSDEQTGWGSTEFVVLRPKAPLPPYHGYLLARHPAFREHAIQSMSGTSGRQRVQNDVLGRYPVVVPSAEVAGSFGEVVGGIQQKIAANHQQAQTLASLRDTLLPRLISGQLRLPEAEYIIEKAVS